MKKRFLSLALALMLCLSLLPGMALAASSDDVTLDITVRDFKKDGILFDSDIIQDGDEGLVQDTLGADKKPIYNLSRWQEIYGEGVTQGKLNALFNDVSGVNMSTKKSLTMKPDGTGYWVIDSSTDENGNYSDGFFPIDDELFGNEEYHHNYHFSVEIHTKFKYVQGAELEFNGDDDVWVFFNGKLVMDLGGVHGELNGNISMDEIASSLGVKIGDIVSFDMFYMERNYSGSNMYIRTNFDFLNLEASAWAQAELAEADALGLIPDALVGADLTEPITRAEFAAVAVKVYENLSGEKAVPVVDNPFTDTNDVEVLKAKNVGITDGTSKTTFAPNVILNREQCATMLTRVFKKVSIAGWTLDTDSSFNDTFKAMFTMPAAFADDKDISGWAKDSVYFMKAKGIIDGVGNSMFAPKHGITVNEAANYGLATREHALLIAVRMVKNLPAA